MSDMLTGLAIGIVLSGANFATREVLFRLYRRLKKTPHFSK